MRLLAPEAEQVPKVMQLVGSMAVSVYAKKGSLRKNSQVGRKASRQIQGAQSLLGVKKDRQRGDFSLYSSSPLFTEHSFQSGERQLMTSRKDFLFPSSLLNN
jgi:hypothetical protein